MAAKILILRILFLVLTAALYAVPFLLDAGRGPGFPSNNTLSVVGMLFGCLGYYLFFLLIFIVWVSVHLLFLAAWSSLALGNDWGARRIAVKGVLLGAAYLFVLKPFALGALPHWDVVWITALIAVVAAAVCLQLISSHYEELDRRASLVKRWLTHADDSGTWTPADSGERSTSIQKLTAPTHSL